MTLNSLGLIPQLERKEIILNNLEVGFLFNKSNFITNVHESPTYVIGGYHKVHKNLTSKRFLERMIYHTK